MTSKPSNPNYLRRSRHHDYTRPARYLITLSKSDSIEALGRIADNPPHIDLSPQGQAFEAALAEWRLLYPDIEIPAYQIMPDHIHLCIDVRAYLRSGLSRAIGRLMSKTTRALDCGANAVSAFSKGFNDRIAYNPEQWERQKKYVADNPRRYIIKKLHPDLFYKRWLIEIGSDAYIAQGNIMLLKNPDIQVVRYSRKYTQEEFEEKKGRWRECVRTGGVLISPFIHPNEKNVRNGALAYGGSIIRVCENGFSERFCPHGEEFEYSGSSRLLLIAPFRHNSQKEALTYAKAQSLNRIAEEIAATDWFNEEGRIKQWR